MKINTASMIALVVAGLVLVAVGGKSYSDYLRAQYEKEYGVLDQHQAGAKESPAPGAPVSGGADVLTSTLDPGSAQLPPTGSSAYRTDALPPAQGQVNPPNQRGNPLPNRGAPLPPAGSTAPDPDLAKLQARLKALEQESALYQKKFEQVRSGGGAPPSIQEQSTESGSLREVMAREANGASPALFPKEGGVTAAQRGAKAEYERQISVAPMVGKVVEFNAKWGFVQIDAGKNRNIKPGTKLAVRRGALIVGYVKVDEVNDESAIAELTSRNEFSETALKPKPGDDLINWPLF